MIHAREVSLIGGRRPSVLVTSFQDDDCGTIPPARLNDAEYEKALRRFIGVCTDIVLVHSETRSIYLAWRLQKPNANTYWWMGGGIRPGTPIERSAAEIFKRETGVSLDPNRLTLAACIDYYWKDRAQEPTDIGCHMIGYTFFFEPVAKEIAAIARSLDANEYDATRGLTIFNRERIVELIESHEMHPAVLAVYDQIFPAR